jgi:hypothetical protein
LLKLFSGKLLMLLSFFQQARFQFSGSRVLRQYAQVRRLPCMVIGRVPRKRSQYVIVAQYASPNAKQKTQPSANPAGFFVVAFD